MRCQFCSAPMPKQGFICSYCHKRNSFNLSSLPKNIEIVNDAEKYDCSICKIELENLNIGSKEKVLIQHCSKCDGIFIKENIMKQLIDKQTVDRKKFDYLMIRFIKKNPRHAIETNAKYKNCPVCKKMMQRYNYGAISGVILDRCVQGHGIWLDAGELKQIIEWKYHGGTSKDKQDTSLSINIGNEEENYKMRKELYRATAVVDNMRSKKNQMSQLGKSRPLNDEYNNNESIFDIVLDIIRIFSK